MGPAAESLSCGCIDKHFVRSRKPVPFGRIGEFKEASLNPALAQRRRRTLFEPEETSDIFGGNFTGITKQSQSLALARIQIPEQSGMILAPSTGLAAGLIAHLLE